MMELEGQSHFVSAGVHQLSGPAFIRPSRTSRAINIVNPQSGESLDVHAATPSGTSNPPKVPPPSIKRCLARPGQQTSGAYIPRQTPVSTRKLGLPESAGLVRAYQTTPLSLPLLGLNHLAEKAAASLDGGFGLSDEEVQRAFSVYTRPFVPQVLRDINRLPHILLHGTPRLLEIDYGSYISRSVLGRSAPRDVKITLPPVPVAVPLSSIVVPYDYLYRFRVFLDDEFSSQQQENKALDLYEHKVMISIPASWQQRTQFSFEFPGLRENALRFEEDDLVEFRQLKYDFSGKLLGGIPLGSPRLANVHPAESHRWSPWTGHVFIGRVTAIHRASQMLYVEFQAVIPQTLGLAYRPFQCIGKFNIKFPVRHKRFQAMLQAVTFIEASLGTRPTDATFDSRLKGRLASRDWIQSMLFPRSTDSQMQTILNPGAFNRLLFDPHLNWEQQKAVDAIVSCNYGTLPYLISGPPGTGKTKTLIETALQMLQFGGSDTHILLCAPSDPAADTLAERLSAQLSPKELFRLIKPARTFAEVHGSLLPYCYTTPDNHFGLPVVDRLLSFKIVVTTCQDADILVKARLTNIALYAARELQRVPSGQSGLPGSENQANRLHWNALLMDEAAQAMEPEAVIPISVVAPPAEHAASDHDPTPLIVMAGDEHQLGPRTSQPKTPLKLSLFARLFRRPVYANHPLARGRNQAMPPPLSKSMLPIPRPAFANLIRNYRSHPAILAVPSHRFYFDTLEAAADASETNRLASWEGWRGRRWPVLFHSNPSRDERELNEGGWYNVHEAGLACDYAVSLVKSGLVAQEEVCIMSPFKAQVRLLRQTMQLPRFGMRDVNIGPTEAFQGLEKGVVILCTTRSKPAFVEQDIERGWGIVNQPNQMNVALTRAKFGLIVIGKREVLGLDENWRAVLAFCDRNGLVAGEVSNHVGGHATATAAAGAATAAYSGSLTRLEKGLLAGENDRKRSSSADRALGGIGEQDEMWANELGYDEAEHDDDEEGSWSTTSASG